jgi:uncharacterized protein YgiM (DUF1202 family)
MSDDAPIPEQTVTCPACGAENRQSARFCRQCGSKVAADVAVSPPSVSPIQSTAAPSPSQPDPPSEPERASASPPKQQDGTTSAAAEAASPPRASWAQKMRTLSPNLKRPVIFIPVAIAGLAIIALLAFFLVGPAGDIFAPSVKEFANRDAQVASSIDSSAIILGNLQRGDAIVGKWVKAPGGQARWLKVKWPVQGSGYIWGPDLSDRTRPNITLAGPVYPAAAISSVVYAEPDPQSSVIDDLSQGETATVVGATSDGWAEIALNAGGVGYVKADAFQSTHGPSSSANIDASPVQIAALSGITHYTCAFSPDQSKNPPTTAALSFYLDEGRTCIDHRYAYFADEAGGLKRVMLSDKDRRASLLYFMPDRKSFYRTDFTLSPDDYTKLLKTSAALESAICSPPADTKDATALRGVLKRATPTLDVQTPGVVWQKRVWQCTAEK